MNLRELKRRVGKNVKVYNDTGGWVTNREVGPKDVQDYLNEVYTEEIAPVWYTQFPDLFRQTAQMDSWIMSTTINSVSTTTLVINTVDGSFSNSMPGLNVYNEDQDETIKISSYTNTSTVTMESTVADWEADDTIYVLGDTFAFGGDASDLIQLESVGLKYNSTDSFYTKCDIRYKRDIYYRNDITVPKAAPYAYITNVQDSGSNYMAVTIVPKFDNKVTDALEIDYIGKPTDLTSETASPIMPINQSLIAGATMKCFERKQNYEKAAYWRGVYQQSIREELSRYTPVVTSDPTKVRVKRNVYKQQIRSI